MADLKTGTTIGNKLVWTQGNFPLFPTGDSVLYKNFKLYSEYDKPKAIDNDFVSKASGGTYGGSLFVKTSINLTSESFSVGGIQVGNADGASLANCNMDITSWYGVGFKSTSGARTVAIDTRTGDITTTGNVNATKQVVIVSPAPLVASHATRKDYVDAINTNLTNSVNTKVSKNGDTMTGNLTVPAIVLTAEAANQNHAARLSQVVVKATVLDYGTF